MSNDRLISSQQDLETCTGYEPTEIAADLLDLVGGGTPKGTWTEPELLVASSDPGLTPKGTW